MAFPFLVLYLLSKKAIFHKYKKNLALLNFIMEITFRKTKHLAGIIYRLGRKKNLFLLGFNPCWMTQQTITKKTGA